jgi:hypothetical protein
MILAKILAVFLKLFENSMLNYALCPAKCLVIYLDFAG